MTWRTLRKTGAGLHLSYGHTFTNNLSVHNTRLRTSPAFELAPDLNGNLRTRNKAENSYQDASQLADGEIKSLKLVQIDDDQILDRLGSVLTSLDQPSDSWILTIELGDSHSFRVRPEVQKSGGLTSSLLRVVSELEGGV